MRYYFSHGDGGGQGVDVGDSIVHRQCNIGYLQACCLQIKPETVRSGIARVNLCTLSVQIMQAGTQ